MNRNQGLSKISAARFVSSNMKNSKSKKTTDAVSLASALGLLSPSKDIFKTHEYKPSLFRNLQRGSVTEEYANIKTQIPKSLYGSDETHRKSIAALMANLQNANDHFSLLHNDGSRAEMTKNLKDHVRSLTNEAELLNLLRSSFAENTLTFPLLMTFLLNRNLRDLSKLPFDINNINKSDFGRSGWTKTQFADLKILMLKKYHDLEQPLDIIRILKEDFKKEFMPLIRTRSISPFSERIVWKFYFEYIGLGQEHVVIKKMNSLRCSFLIWEASSLNNSQILKSLMNQHKFNSSQLIFLKVASSDFVQGKISEQLSTGRSAILSALKKVSVKYKIYKSSVTNDVASRAFAFSLIHTLECFLATHFTSQEDKLCLREILTVLKKERTQLIQPEILGHEEDNIVSYAS